MQKIEFGSTGLVIEKNGFGCLPIRRISETEAVKLLHKACDGGINFFDTARAYSDSEQKVGAAFSGMRDRIVLATKTGAQTAKGFWCDLEPVCAHSRPTTSTFTSSTIRPSVRSRAARTVRRGARGKKAGEDPPHFHHEPSPCGGAGGHRLRVIRLAAIPVQLPCRGTGARIGRGLPHARYGVYRDEGHGRRSAPRRLDRGGLDGGAGNVVPIWGVQRERKLDQFLQCIREGAELTDERRATIERDRRELCGEFCRGCGYCMIPRALRSTSARVCR